MKMELRKTKAGTGMSRFLSWYGNRKRKAMANDATLSFRQFLVKIGLLFVFILVDSDFLSLGHSDLPPDLDGFLHSLGGRWIDFGSRGEISSRKDPNSANFHPKLQQNFRRKNLVLLSQI